MLLVHTAHDVIRQGVCRSDMGQRLARVRDWFRMPLLEKPVQVFENPAQLRDRGSHRRLRTYPGVAGAVLQRHVSVSRPSDATDGPALPSFAADAVGHAMALPVRVGGEVVAVLYADAAGPDAPSSDARWPAVLEVLVRHASRVLEAMTVQQAAGLSLPRPERTVAGSDRTLVGGAQ